MELNCVSVNVQLFTTIFTKYQGFDDKVNIFLPLFPITVSLSVLTKYMGGLILVVFICILKKKNQYIEKI